MRWTAKVTYHTDAGLLVVPFDFDEIADLDEMIERGPSFATVESIIIRYTLANEALTVEAAAEL